MERPSQCISPMRWPRRALAKPGAFYDALEVNDSAVDVMGDDQLKVIVRELVEKVGRSVSVNCPDRLSDRYPKTARREQH